MARYKFVDMSPRLLPVSLEAQLSHAICPAGQRLYRNGRDCALKGGYQTLRVRKQHGPQQHARGACSGS